MEKIDWILCECDLVLLQNFVSALEADYTVQVAEGPRICLTMIKAEDSMEHQPFYLGEALTTYCEVIVQATAGYGLCVGDEPVRSYCIAVVDALMKINDRDERIVKFLSEQQLTIEQREREEHNLILRTKVDFKLMEQQ